MTYIAGLIPDFQEHFRGALKTHVKVNAAVRFVGIFVGIGRTNVHGNFRYSERRQLSRWPARTSACANPRQIRTDVAPKTIEAFELRVGYVKNRFGKLCRQDIKRPDVLAFMRSYEAEGKLETRDRVRSIGEQICNYADVEGDGYNPFCNLNGQMIANISTPRPGVTEPRDVTRVFKLISAPWTRARFSDVVGHAARFDPWQSSTLVENRPGPCRRRSGELLRRLFEPAPDVRQCRGCSPIRSLFLSVIWLASRIASIAGCEPRWLNREPS
jgi:hypothetical protein